MHYHLIAKTQAEWDLRAAGITADGLRTWTGCCGDGSLMSQLRKDVFADGQLGVVVYWRDDSLNLGWDKYIPDRHESTNKWIALFVDGDFDTIITVVSEKVVKYNDDVTVRGSDVVVEKATKLTREDLVKLLDLTK